MSEFEIFLTIFIPSILVIGTLITLLIYRNIKYETFGIDHIIPNARDIFKKGMKRTQFFMCPISTVNLTVLLPCSWKSTIKHTLFHRAELF